MSDWRIHIFKLLDGDQESDRHFPQEVLRKQSISLSVFLSEKVIPAFEEFKAELIHYGRQVFIARDRNTITIEINYEDSLELSYTIVFLTKMGILYPQVNFRYVEDSLPILKKIVLPYGELDPSNPLTGINKDQVISHLVSTYMRLNRKK